MRIAFLTLLFGMGIVVATAQQTKMPVAVFPFAVAQADYQIRAIQVQELVVDILRQRPGIEVLDRARDSFILKELNNQIREQSIVTPGMIAQGKLEGARQIIVGIITYVALELDDTTSSVYRRSPTALLYRAIIDFSLQLCDVETGKVISQRNFSSKDAGKGIFPGIGASKGDAINNGIRGCRRAVVGWLNEIYPPEIKIAKIEERDKRGDPKTVLVFGLDVSVPKGTTIGVFEVEEFTPESGVPIVRRREIGRLQLVEVQGEIAVCKVISGGKEIEEKMMTRAKLEYRIK